MANNDVGVDRFSSLPDSLLLTIVSILPFKDAARTSVLSKRWLHVWHGTQNIEFNEAFFVAKNEENDEDKENGRNAFVSFVRQWIQHYQEPVTHKFRLVFSQPRNYLSEMKQFIQFAIDHKVKVLDLDFSDPSWQKGTKMALLSTFLQLPLYDEHESLESLRLFSCFINVRQFKFFPAIKSICLGWITFNDRSVKTLLSKCPMLENLTLTNIYHDKNLEIIAPRLKTLVIEKCFEQEKVYIDAPRLQFLKYSGELVEFQFVGLHSMVEAVLDFGLEKDYIEDYGYILYYNLNDIGSIRFLTVCSYMLQVISYAVDPLLPQPILPRLQQLALETALSTNEFYGITFFLNHCPSLEVLSIHIGTATIFADYEPPYTFEEHPFFATRTRVEPYDCVRNTLRVVQMKGCKGERNEFLLLKYLLKYGGVLERLYISVSKDMESILQQITQRLMHYEIASPSVELIPYVE